MAKRTVKRTKRIALQHEWDKYEAALAERAKKDAANAKRRAARAAKRAAA